MRLLADENIPLETVRALRLAGHDVFAVTESSPGAADEALLELARGEARVVVTFDRDFGDLVVRGGGPKAPGVILLRFVPRSADEVTALLQPLLARSDITWLGYLSVVDALHVRQRPL
jgi:predicted nuclease of predicted toxin-antitoxin system